MGTILAFRHGEAAVNRPDLFVPGDDDRSYPLTDIGMMQAKLAGTWAVETFDWVKNGEYVAAVSEFVRARETYQFMGLPKLPLVLPGLNELDWGDFMSPDPPERLRQTFDADYETHIGTRAPYGESSLDVYRRLASALWELVAGNADSNILLVTHGRALIVLRMIIEGVPPTDAGWRFMRQNVNELPNCGALCYADVRLAAEDVSDGQVDIIQPPYLPAERFLRQPFLGAAFKAASA